MYDIIGDIHGHADKLVLLLQKLGYKHKSGLWSHPSRKLISVGDLIDRGPYQREVVDILRTMQEAGQAHVIMGNHEFNAISWFLNDESDHPLRAHTDKNHHQHRAFLEQANPSSDWYLKTIEWFKSLPLFIETNEFCCIHAAWDTKHVNYLKSVLSDTKTLNATQWLNANTKGHPLYDAIEYCLKGPEVNLPTNDSFLDGNNNIRRKIRYKWWSVDNHSTYQTAAVSVPDTSLLPNKPLPLSCIDLAPVSKSVFFGHYWMTGKPQILSSTIACLDWSVVKEDGYLVAYRFDGKSRLENTNFVWV
jgi:hypothetical protein